LNGTHVLSGIQECSRTSSVDGGIANESPATNFSCSAPKITPQPSLPNVISVGQLLESVCNSLRRLIVSFINMDVQDSIHFARF
jgi:hypothetical protein